MELKKSKKADLERNRGVFLQIGLVVVLSLMLIAFEWTTKPETASSDKLVADASFEVEEMQITRRDEPKPEPIQQQQVAEILNIVQDDATIDDDFDFDVEANAETEFKFTGFAEEKEEFVEEEVFYIVEDMPTFNGGDPATEFRKYIFQNLKYPEIARKAGVEGTVFVQVLVDVKGLVVDTRVVKSLGNNGCDEAAIDAIKKVKWKPAMQRDRPVKVWISIPVRFKLK